MHSNNGDRPADGHVAARRGDYHIPWENSGFGNWSIQTRTGVVACTNSTFRDPFQYRQKQCEYEASGLRWHFCAHEGGTCELSSDQWVRYGSSDPYAPGPDTGSNAALSATCAISKGVHSLRISARSRRRQPRERRG